MMAQSHSVHTNIKHNCCVNKIKVCSLVRMHLFLYNGIAMKNLTFITPYTDSILKWNETTNRYELTLQFIKSELDVNFANDDVTEKRSKKNSRKIYNFIKARTHSKNTPFIDLLLNRTEEGRRFLKDILLEQLEADNETGFNDLSSQPGIDIASGREIDRDSLERNQISVDTEQIAYRNDEYFGFNILLAEPYPPTIYFYLRGSIK